MKRNENFEIVDVSNEYVAIPIEEEADRFRGIVVLSEPAAFLLKHLDQHMTEEDLYLLILEEYDVDSSVARSDVRNIVQTFYSMGLVKD